MKSDEGEFATGGKLLPQHLSCKAGQALTGSLQRALSFAFKDRLNLDANIIEQVMLLAAY